MEKKEIITLVSVIIVVLGLGVILSLNEPAASPEETREPKGIAFDILPANHIEPGEDHIPYNSNPPTSGPHWGTPAQRGFYEDTLPDEQIVHNLEHGEIWISYRSDLDQSGIDELRNIQGRHRGSVIVTRRDANDSKITLVSWGYLMNLDEVDINAIEDFVQNNINNSPEPFAR